VPTEYPADWMYWTFGVVLLLIANIACWVATVFTLPGNWGIVLLAALCAWLLPEPDGMRLGFGWIPVIVLAALAGVGELIEFFAGAAGAARQGASRRAMALALVGAALGSIVGAILGVPIPVVGSIIAAIGGGAAGAFAGAWLGEYWKGRASHERLAIGTGAMLGRVVGTIGKLVVGAVMVAYATAESFLI
jgi:uncharacterized protein YqgC (DUF456 family)